MPPINTQLKYKRAIEWCEKNRDKLPRYCKFKLYSTPRLYEMLEAFGVNWRADLKMWWGLDRSEEGAEIAGNVPPIPRRGDPGRTLVRIIAKNHLIGKRVAEFTELCEALNWNVVKVSNQIGENGIEYVRVYLTIVVEDGD